MFVIPRLYIAQGYDAVGRIDGKVVWDPIAYLEQIVRPNLFFKIGQLWFLPVLFVTAAVNYPLIAWSRRRKANLPLDSDDLRLCLGQFGTLLMLLFLGFCTLKNRDDFYNYLVPASFMMQLSYASFYVF